MHVIEVSIAEPIHWKRYMWYAPDRLGFTLVMVPKTVFGIPGEVKALTRNNMRRAMVRSR